MQEKCCIISEEFGLVKDSPVIKAQEIAEKRLPTSGYRSIRLARVNRVNINRK